MLSHNSLQIRDRRLQDVETHRMLTKRGTGSILVFNRSADGRPYTHAVSRPIQILFSKKLNVSLSYIITWWSLENSMDATHEKR